VRERLQKSGAARARRHEALGKTPLAIEAFSWLGRGALAKKQCDVAMTYAARATTNGRRQLKTRQLDAESHLPIALGASDRSAGARARRTGTPLRKA
jgi:hypothetical protein